jgi:hypothetical protein
VLDWRSFALVVWENMASESVRQDPKHVRKYVRIRSEISYFQILVIKILISDQVSAKMSGKSLGVLDGDQGSSKGMRLRRSPLQVFCAFRFHKGPVLAFLAGETAPKATYCVKHCAAARNRPLQEGLRKARGATPIARRASSQRLIVFFNTIATCTKSDNSGTVMMLLHGDHNDDAVISGIYTPMGQKILENNSTCHL